LGGNYSHQKGYNTGKENYSMDEKKVRFTPEMFINYYISHRGITVEDVGVAPVVVISWSPKVIQALAECTGAEPAPNWLNTRYLFFSGEVQGQRVSFAQVGIGAPNTITAMEEMIACGARLFIGLGWAGSLQPEASIGRFLLPTTCIREEGTSSHYVDDDVEVAPDGRLLEILKAAAQEEDAGVLTGPHWTTDAPYREFTSKIDEYRERGVLGVDMETSAMYALGQFREVAVCNLLVISDELWQDWNPAFGSPELNAANEVAQGVVLCALKSEGISELV
jgi:uridine phosphorylase